MSSLLMSHSCLSGRAGSMTNCVSVKPSWSSSAKRTYSRTTLTSWTTLAKWCNSWWTSTAQPRGLTTFPGERKNSEQTFLSYNSTSNQPVTIHGELVYSNSNFALPLFHFSSYIQVIQNRQVFGFSCFSENNIYWLVHSM